VGRPADGRADGRLIRVLVVDDQELARAGLRRLLRRRDGFDVVGECADGDEVIDAVRSLAPDVVLMDVRMRRMHGDEATRRLAELPDAPPVLILTTFDDDGVVAASISGGASGFVLKEAPAEELIRALQEVATGGAWLDPRITGKVIASYRAFSPRLREVEAIDKLTDRERQVLRLVAEGASNSEIAKRLYISEATVKSHTGRIFSKLGLRSRAEAIVLAYEHRLA
jgi:DNA-binding NarL/FixJ family response regulator